MSLESAWTTVGGLRLHSRRTTTEPASPRPVVLLPGLGLSWRAVGPAALALGPHAPTHVLELPGFGASEAPRHVPGIDEHAAVVAAWIEENGLERPVVAGNSFGSEVAARLAATRPELVAAVALGAPMPEPEHRNLLVNAGRLLVVGVRAPWPLVRIALADYFRAGPWRVVRSGHIALRDPIRVDLERIHAPAVVLRGCADPMAMQQWAEEAARLLPHGRLVDLPGAGHAAPWETPAEFAAPIVELLREL